MANEKMPVLQKVQINNQIKANIQEKEKATTFVPMIYGESEKKGA